MPPTDTHKPDAGDPGQMNIGETIRQMRATRGVSLSRLAERANVSKSNLSKIENNVISPTFDMMGKISQGLGVTTSELLSHGRLTTDMLSFTDAGEGGKSSSGHYEFEFLFSELSNRKMIPIITTIQPHESESISSPSSHGGEEFFYVVEGIVDFLNDGKVIKTMKKGDAVYFSSGLQHLAVNRQSHPAQLLWVWLA